MSSVGDLYQSYIQNINIKIIWNSQYFHFIAEVEKTSTLYYLK